jgi:5-methyltetrahydrofolate--homocysteine methyltransferase
LWNLTHPEVVAEVHALDLDAGADAVLTNTFGGNRVWLARYGMAASVFEINRRAVALARQANGPARFVIGAIGPTAAEAPDALREQVDALLADDAVDALLFETYRLDQAESALASLGDVAGLPLIVSLARWPEPVEDAARTLEDLGASVLGGNCQVGTAAALEMAGRLAVATRLPLWVKPAAGLPGGESESPAAFASAVHALLARGVRFLGGCCGTTEAHVAALRAACYDHRTG